ncbi:MAG: Rpn family recombination-promoting nuclease/putative transposase [Bacteroidales bacterium]|nr:Rpn family recombination-promoting nuclease/putative transposase [Bacteroidales bacterium]
MQYEFKYADLLDDDVFKLVFGQESSKDVMIEFLNQVIDDRTIVDLEFMDKEMKSMDREKKDSVYDMFCKTDDGSRIVVEVQRRKQASYVERTIYYSTFQVRNQVDAGREDYAFCPVYVINILDFNIDENRGNPEVKTVYRLYEEKTHALLTDKLTFIFLELNKFKKGLEELDGNVLEGMYFCLKNMARLDGCPEVLTHEVFRKMFHISELLNMDEDTRSKVLIKMTTERDLRNQMAYARKEAIEEGLAEGRAQGQKEKSIEIARKLLAAGYPEDEVLELTGANVDEL